MDSLRLEPHHRGYPVYFSVTTCYADNGTSLSSQAVNRIVEDGTVVVTSAGNSGDYGLRIGAPAAAEKAIAVGAIEESEDYIAAHSSRGPVGGAQTRGSSQIWSRQDRILNQPTIMVVTRRCPAPPWPAPMSRGGCPDARCEQFAYPRRDQISSPADGDRPRPDRVPTPTTVPAG